MNIPLPFSDIQRHPGLKVAIGLGVAVLHLGLFVALGLVQSPPSTPQVQTPVLVTLVRSEPVVVPEPTVISTPTEGGGAPAAASSIRLAPLPPEPVVELTAPSRPATLQPVVMGLASEAAPNPEQGSGLDGQARGEGSGDGNGPGRGAIPPMLLRGATPAEILSVVPQAARRARQSGRASVNCAIRFDERVDDCRIVSESPSGFGFGEAGLQAVRFFRYRPPATADGRPIEGQRVTITVQFGRQ